LFRVDEFWFSGMSIEPTVATRHLGWWWGLALILAPSLALLSIETFQVAAVIPDVKDSQKQVGHTLDVISTAQVLDHEIQDAERGQRGYLITGDDAYLEPYTTGTKAVPEKLKTLKQLTADDPEQQQRIDRLQRQIDIKLPEMQSTIDAYRSGGFEAAQGIVKTDVGSAAMGKITGLVTSIIAAEHDRLRERQGQVSAAIQRDTRVTGVAAILAVTTMAVGGYLLITALRRSRHAHTSLVASEERFRLLVQGVQDYAIYMFVVTARMAATSVTRVSRRIAAST
jgi:methyl-accepting chemotaxis protein